MTNAKLSAACFAMSYLTNPERVRSTVSSLGIEQADAPAYVGAGCKLSATVVTPKYYKNLKEYASDMNRYLLAARQQSSQLVALPELSGMLPLSLMPGFEKIFAELWQQSTQYPADRATLLRQVCRSTQGFVGEVFLTTLSELCRLHQIAAAASCYVVDNGKLYNRQYLFSTDGTVGGMQDKLILSPQEGALGVTAGEKLTPASTPVGQVALLSASALGYYQPFAIARELGCVAATISASPFGEDMRCAPFRAEESGLALLSAGFASSRCFALEKSAPALLFAPRAASKNQSCLLREETGEGVYTARIDIARAKASLDLYTADRNPDFFEKMIEQLPFEQRQN